MDRPLKTRTRRATIQSTIKVSSAAALGLLGGSVGDLRAAWAAPAQPNQGATIVLTASTTSAPLGSAFSVTATVRNGQNGRELEGVVVAFTASGAYFPAVNSSTTTAVTNSDGRATVSLYQVYSGRYYEGQAVVVASLVSRQGQTTVSDPVTVTFYRYAPLTLDPSSQSCAVGTYCTVYTHGGSGTVSVVSGPNTGVTLPIQTGSSGDSSVYYQSTAAGTDTLQASYVNILGQTIVSAPVTVTWL